MKREEILGVRGWTKISLIILIVTVIAIVTVICAFVLAFSNNPKMAVKDFTKAFSNSDAAKLIKSMDVIGFEIWDGYSFDEKDFSEEDYKEFKEEYKETKDYINLKEEEKAIIEEISEYFNIMKQHSNYKIEVEEFKDVKKLNEDLYVVETKVNVVSNYENEMEISFVVYKDKVISGGLIINAMLDSFIGF